MHATIPKGIVGGFEFNVLQRNLKEWHEARGHRRMFANAKESNNRRFDSYSVRNSALIISHIMTFRDRCVHIFSDNLSRNSCISIAKRPWRRGARRNGCIRRLILEHEICRLFIPRGKQSLYQRISVILLVLFKGTRNRSDQLLHK